MRKMRITKANNERDFEEAILVSDRGNCVRIWLMKEQGKSRRAKTEVSSSVDGRGVVCYVNHLTTRYEMMSC